MKKIFSNSTKMIKCLNELKNSPTLMGKLNAIIKIIGIAIMELLKGIVKSPYVAITIVVIIALMAVYAFVSNSGWWNNYSYKFDLDFTEGLAREQTYVDESTLYNAFYDVVSETSYYQVFYVSQLDTEPNNVILEAFFGEKAARKFNEDKKLLKSGFTAAWGDLNKGLKSLLGFQTVDPRQVIHDANYAGISGLKQSTSFTTIDAYNSNVSDLDYYRDHYARENNFVISSGLLKELNSKVLNDVDAGDDVGKIIYPEAFTKPVQFSRDYMRVQPYKDDEGNVAYRDYVYITKRVIMSDITNDGIKITNVE